MSSRPARSSSLTRPQRYEGYEPAPHHSPSAQHIPHYGDSMLETHPLTTSAPTAGMTRQDTGLPYMTPPNEPLPQLPSGATPYDAHSIDISETDGGARSLHDGVSVTSRTGLRPSTADTSRGGGRSQSRSRERGAAVFPADEQPPVPRVHIDASRAQTGGQHHNGRSNSSPKRETLSEKVMRSGYSTPPVLSRGSTNDYLSAGGGGAPYQNISAQSSNANLLFAEGDFLPAPKGRVARAFVALFNANILIRWFFFITPILALLWIPGIVGLTAKPDAAVWSVKLVWWSAWLSVWWGGWWVGLAVAKLAPPLLHFTVGTVLPMLDPWFGHLSNMQQSITRLIWSLMSWITFDVLINKHKGPNPSDGDNTALYYITRGLFGILLSCAILAIEKLLVQIIAAGFHQRAYEDRILEQKAAISALTTLYVNSHDIGRKDTLDREALKAKDPAHLIRSALKGVRNVAQASTTIFGTVASEIAGERILQPNAPESMVTHALGSSNKSRQLARRLYFSFCLPGHEALIVDDIARFFRSHEAAEAAFRLFDRDENGDVSLEEMEMAVLETHRERLALASSMRDLDSAVGRLDDILMFVWSIVSILIIVALLNVSFEAMLASAGTLILGLSWLIGSTAQEILASIVFLFVKHPYDVSDRVDIDTTGYVVKEIHLLFTVFRQLDGKIAQIPHSVLSTKSVINIRRSGAISETFKWNVDFGTSFEKIEALRERLLEFLRAERRDFIPAIDISIDDFEDQGQMSLKCDIKYKSNWQNGTLKAQRRNKFICAMKLALAELEIFGPKGAGNPSPAPDTQLIKLVNDDDETQAQGQAPLSPNKPTSPTSTGSHDAALIQRLNFGGGNDAVLRDSQTDIFFEKGVRRRISNTSGGHRRPGSLSITSNPAQVATARDAAAAVAKSEQRGVAADDLEMQLRQR